MNPERDEISGALLANRAFTAQRLAAVDVYRPLGGGFDSADVYSDGLAEETLGRAIKGKRDRLLISTKAMFQLGDGPNDYGSSRHHLLASVENALGYPPYAAHQAYYSLLHRDYEWELMPVGRDQGVGTVVWSPLGWGKLTGKIRRGHPAKPGTRAHDIAGTGPHFDPERLFRIVDVLDEIAKETGKTIPQIALNWLLQQPTVASLIIGPN